MRAAASDDLPSAIPDRTVRHRLAGEDLIRYGLVAVFAIVLFLFVLYPLLHVIWRSLLDAAGGFVGLANYRRYFGTPPSPRPSGIASPSRSCPWSSRWRWPSATPTG